MHAKLLRRLRPRQVSEVCLDISVWATDDQPVYPYGETMA